jgi:glycosyltransferase involved in cell wall biosynthesis
MSKWKVCVLDMQPVTPVIGGGRQRLLGLYHNLGEDVETVYVGTYDWPGEPFRDHHLTPTLREICVPLSEAHHRVVQETARRMNGRGMIDLEFCDQVYLSPEYLAVARREMRDADIVIFSHPWCYPPLASDLKTHQLVVYDAHNVESVLRVSLHDDLPAVEPILRRVVEVEYKLCCDADIVLACSHEDREVFARVYGIDHVKIRVVPNGIFVLDQSPLPLEQKEEVRNRLVPGAQALAVFLGSDYAPNNEAADFIISKLAQVFPRITFAILGSCCQTLYGKFPDNVRVVGIVDDETKRNWMQAADIALNPLSRGSGTSIKMFDFMAAGLPVITTEIGGRGIVSTGKTPFVITLIERFPEAIERLMGSPDERTAVGCAARDTVEKFYAWERISSTLGMLLHKRRKASRKSMPYFTVVIPSYERHGLLDRLVERLQAQTERDFEVVIVDQSLQRWARAEEEFGFPLTYVHSSIKGAVKARNLGGFLAFGEVIAFTDDDCEPSAGWLLNARKHFIDPNVVGIEGLINSDHYEDPDWRPVTNIGFEGIGFMTANLLVRNRVFQRLDGFDLAFDEPHFREDTDFGWRMQAIGSVPFANDVVVYHPAHRRDVERESHAERNRFFEKDPLLLRKHPEKYRRLFFAEAHYRQTVGFWEHFNRGAMKYGIDLPQWIVEMEGSTILSVTRNSADPPRLLSMGN